MKKSKYAGMLPSHLLGDLVALGKNLLTQAQDAHGFLSSKTRNAVGYSDPQERERVQRNLDHAVGLLCVAHVMAIFEKHFPSKYWDAILDSADVQRLKAYRHIRHCAANGFTGQRPQDDHADFDAVMASDVPLSGVIRFTPTELFLSERIGNEACEFLQRVKDKAIVAAHP